MMARQEQHQQQRKTKRSLLFIDIGGASIPLVGSEETVRALHQNQCTNVTCCDCATFLYCVDTATMVLCPECRSVSPILTTSDPNGNNLHSLTSSSNNHKITAQKLVGLGLTVECVVAEFNRHHNTES